MADQLATPADLASLLQEGVDTATATLLIETATAIVQEACGGQRLVQVVGDVLNIMGTTDSWLPLPQLPVTAVTSVTLDGTALTVGPGTNQYQVFGNRLWRAQGWQTQYGYPLWDSGEGEPWWTFAPPNFTWPAQNPSQVVVTYTHGYAAGSQDLQLARSAALSLAATGYANPSAVASESIDDYSVSYGSGTSTSSGGGPMQLTPTMRALLRKKYGRRAGLVRLG